MDDAPFIVTSDGVLVAPSQIANVVGVFQIIEVGWILLVFPEVKFDGATILLAAIDQAFLANALGLHRDPGQGGRQANGDHGGEENDGQQGKAPLGSTRSASCSS